MRLSPIYKIVEKKDQSVDLYKNNVFVKTYYPSIDLEKSRSLMKDFNRCLSDKGSEFYKYFYEYYFF